jgi:hypothetical protein
MNVLMLLEAVLVARSLCVRQIRRSTASGLGPGFLLLGCTFLGQTDFRQV